jgi:hypothetical protein
LTPSLRLFQVFAVAALSSLLRRIVPEPEPVTLAVMGQTLFLASAKALTAVAMAEAVLPAIE